MITKTEKNKRLLLIFNIPVSVLQSICKTLRIHSFSNYKDQSQNSTTVSTLDNGLGLWNMSEWLVDGS